MGLRYFLGDFSHRVNLGHKQIRRCSTPAATTASDSLRQKSNVVVTNVCGIIFKLETILQVFELNEFLIPAD
jgi:hypothetical protein